MLLLVCVFSVLRLMDCVDFLSLEDTKELLLWWFPIVFSCLACLGSPGCSFLALISIDTPGHLSPIRPGGAVLGRVLLVRLVPLFRLGRRNVTIVPVSTCDSRILNITILLREINPIYPLPVQITFPVLTSLHVGYILGPNLSFLDLLLGGKDRQQVLRNPLLQILLERLQGSRVE
jgi:hypothetical protein